ncbi:MAG: hypothetical protein GY759_13475 [Chloroflexi bacterium]|nr:hypothetical protein [Chloroflexota bacterium]
MLWFYEATAGVKSVLFDPTSIDVDVDVTSALWSPEGDAMLLTGEKGLYLLALQSGKLTMVADGGEIGSVSFFPSDMAASFVQNNDLYIVSFEDGQTQRLTNDGSKTVYNDALDRVYTEEMATRAAQPASAWSPDGRWLISLHLDDEEVGSHPIMDYRPIPSTVSTIRYPTAGSANPKASLRMFGFEDGKSTQSVPLSEDAEYILPLFTWSPDSAEALYMTVSRDHKVLDLKAWNPDTGEGRTIIKETDPYWVNEFLYAPPVFLADGQQFLRLSERDGFMHLYLYDIDGALIRQLTQGDWLIDSTPWDILTPGKPVQVDPSGAWAYFSTTESGPLERQLQRLNLESDQVEQLSPPKGFHLSSLSGDGQFLVEQFSGADTTPVTPILLTDGSQVEVLDRRGGPPLPLPQPTREFLTIKAHDGVDLYAQIVKPEDFDPDGS